MVAIARSEMLTIMFTIVLTVVLAMVLAMVRTWIVGCVSRNTRYNTRTASRRRVVRDGTRKSGRVHNARAVRDRALVAGRR